MNQYAEGGYVPRPPRDPEAEELLREAMRRATRQMADDVRRQARERQPFIRTEVRLDPLEATPLLEPDGVVWQITTLED